MQYNIIRLIYYLNSHVKPINDQKSQIRIINFMGDLVAIREKAIKSGTMACQLDKEKKYEEALPKYIEAVEYFSHVIKCN